MENENETNAELSTKVENTTEADGDTSKQKKATDIGK